MEYYPGLLVRCIALILVYIWRSRSRPSSSGNPSRRQWLRSHWGSDFKFSIIGLLSRPHRHNRKMPHLKNLQYHTEGPSTDHQYWAPLVPWTLKNLPSIRSIVCPNICSFKKSMEDNTPKTFEINKEQVWCYEKLKNVWFHHRPLPFHGCRKAFLYTHSWEYQEPICWLKVMRKVQCDKLDTVPAPLLWKIVHSIRPRKNSSKLYGRYIICVCS